MISCKNMLHKILIIVLNTVIALQSARSKVSTGKALLNGQYTEHFLSKFSIGIGVGRLEAKFWVANIYDNPRELSLYIYCDEDWPSVQTATTCREKTQYSRRIEKIVFQHHKHYNNEYIGGRPDKVAQVFRVQVNLTMHIRTHYWYFMLADCTLEEYYHEVPPVYYNVEVYNEPGDNHLPADEVGLPGLYRLNAFIVLCCLFILVYFTIKKAKDTGNVHIILLLLIFSAFLSFVSSVFEIKHLSVYQRDGVGSSLSNTMAATTGAMCDFVMTFLLLSVSCGWTLSSSLPMDLASLGFVNTKAAHRSAFISIVAQLRRPSTLLSNCNFTGFVLLLLLLFHLILVVWGRQYEDEFDKFHDFEHLPGKIFMLFRVLIGIFFWFAATATIELQGNVGKMASFLSKFRLIGFAWFSCMPTCVAFAPLWAEYLRHWWITGGTMLCQSFALGFFSFLLIGTKNSLYYRKSTVGMQNLDLGGKNTLINTDGHNYKGNSKDTSAGRDNHKSYFSNLSNTMQLVKKARIHVD